MPWWDNALYDTCSLITLDKLLLDHPELAHYFRHVVALEASFSADQLREPTAQRMRQRVAFAAMPRASDIARILATAGLPRALADVDKLVYATAVHQGMTVVTGDRRLARALIRHGQHVGNMALILKTLVTTQGLAITACEAILADLVKRHDFILSADAPQTWATLQSYAFP
jgi:hypothetical protein